jgi:hypothetical protein
MFPGCPISKAKNSWKFVARGSLFTSKYNPIFIDGNLDVVHTHLVVYRDVVEFSSFCQF